MTSEALPAASPSPAPPPAEGAALLGSRRIPGLDVLRGIAIVGTLTANIWLFQAFSGDEVVSAWWGDLIRGAADGKFLGLLTIMFGIGLEIQRQAAFRHGRSWPGTYPVRAGLLFVDGVLNYVLVVQFDVLRAYAIVGFVVAFVLLLPERRQWVVIGAALTAHVTLLTIGSERLAWLPSLVLPGDVPEVGGRPSWAESVAVNVHFFLSDLTPGTSDAGTIVMMGLVVFPLGAMLYRKGVFLAEGARLRRWLMIVGLGVGIPVDILIALSGDTRGLDRYLVSTVVAFGLLALVAEFYRRRPVGALGRVLAAVGRMALSCYVLQNVLARALQSWVIGSPIETALDRTAGTLLMYAVVLVLLVVFAVTWQRFFRRGPLESLWELSFRGLTRRSRRAPTSLSDEARPTT